MADIYKGELQDHVGNTVYNHTEADVVFCTDGETVQEKLNRTENALGNTNGTSGSLEVNDANILATTEATHELAENMGGLKFGVDSNGNYGYIKAGADTVTPFSNYKQIKVKASKYAEQSGKTASVTVPSGCTNGLLLITFYGYNNTVSSKLSCSFSNSAGIKNKTTILDRNSVAGSISAFVSLYACEFNAGGVISITVTNNEYPYGHFDVRILA